MKEKLKHYAKEILFFIIVMTIFANAISLYKSQSLNNSPLNIEKVALLNAQHYVIPKDKPILIHIWATWCPTCKLEAGNIQRISKQYEVLTFAVKSGSNEEIQSYMKEHDLDFKVVNDRDGTLASQFKITGFPTTFIYDKNHNIVFSEVGYTSTFGLWVRMWWAGFK
ncbi:MAG: protein disulfide oxidoreductase [Sulfurimonas sp.]